MTIDASGAGSPNAEESSTDLGHEILAFAAEVLPAEARIGALPPPALRTPDEQAIAALNHRTCREARSRFVRANVAWLYHELTQGYSVPLRLDELMARSAMLCPGLVPSEAQLAEERRHAQAEKEGREMDQAILISGILNQQRAGADLLQSMRRPTARALSLSEAFRRNAALDLGPVSMRRSNGVATITIQNDHCLNSEDDALCEALEVAVDLALLDDAVEVGVLRGGVMSHARYAGKRVFSSGINLKELHAGRISFVRFLMTRELGLLQKLQRGLCLDADGVNWAAAARGKPWLAVVDSFAIGGGAQLLLVVDHVLACEGSYFCLPAAQEGIVPGVANLRLPRLLGSKLAKQVILGGRKVAANDPGADKLFDEVVAAGDIDAAVVRSAAMLSGAAVSANRHMLVFADESVDEFRKYMAEFALVQVQRLYARDVLSKLGAFANRVTFGTLAAHAQGASA